MNRLPLVWLPQTTSYIITYGIAIFLFMLFWFMPTFSRAQNKDYVLTLIYDNYNYIVYT